MNGGGPLPCQEYIYRDNVSGSETAPMPKKPPQDSFTLDRHVCFALYGASMAVQRTYKPVLDAMGITYPQYLVMSVLWEGDGQAIGAIAEHLALEPSTITPLVKRLEHAGFVERKRDAVDERRVEVFLTTRGQKLRGERTCLANALLEGSGMRIAELTTLNRQVRQLRDALSRRS